MTPLRFGGSIVQDIKHLGRTFVRTPGFFASMVATLALGISLTTVIASVVDAVLLRPLPFRDAARLVSLGVEEGDYSLPGIPPVAVPVWSAERGLFDAFETYTEQMVDIGGVAEPTSVKATSVSAGMFELLGVSPQAGRLFSSTDTAARATPVTLLSDRFWRRHFGADPAAVGQTVTVHGVVRTIVGIMPPSFTFHAIAPDLWIPVRQPPADERLVRVIARIAPALPVAQARAYALGEIHNRERPNRFGWKTKLTQLGSWRANRDVVRALWIVFAGAGCVLLMACANAANLLLVRNTLREREVAVRAALGAARWRLAQQILVECFCVAIVSGAIGVLTADWMLTAVVPLIPSEVTFGSFHPIGIDARVLGIAALLSFGTTFVFGLVPALYGSKRGANLTAAMVGRTVTASRTATRIQATVLAVQLGVAVVLVSGSLLFARSFMSLVRVDPGIDVDRLAAVAVSLSRRRYPDTASQLRFFARMRESIDRIPGVTAVSFTGGSPPHSGITFGEGLEVEGKGRVSDEAYVIPFAEVDTNYFRTTGTAIIAGRGFTAADRTGDPQPVIIDADFAQMLWGGESAVDRRFRLSGRGNWYTVVGVTQDVKLNGPDDREGRFEMYWPMTEKTIRGYGEFVVRTEGDPAILLPALRRAVSDIDPEQAINVLATMTDRFAEAVAKPRFFLMLMVAFGASALALASVGIYGTVSFAVTQRRREMAIRMAVGATARAIKALVIRRMGIAVSVGVIAGLSTTMLATRFVRNQLFGVTPIDVWSMVGAAAILAATAIAASYAPAARIARTNTLRALTTE